MPAKFYEQDAYAKLKHRRRLSAFLDNLIVSRRGNTRKVHLTYIFCTDSILHNINLQFLNHDEFTDIITFDLTNKASDLRGEIYISVDRITENAKTYLTDYQTELHRVIFHGALHLCGLGDKTPDEIKAMRTAEEEALRSWFTTQ